MRKASSTLRMRSTVADRLNISKHTVYLYIRQFKSGDLLGSDR